MEKYIRDGKEYDSLEAYYNDADLDPDLIYLYLWQGDRTPQNEREKRWKEEADRKEERGESFELSFN